MLFEKVEYNGPELAMQKVEVVDVEGLSSRQAVHLRLQHHCAIPCFSKTIPDSAQLI
jgi:hypothetical protein